MLWITENNIQLFVCNEIVSLGTTFDFPQNDHKLSFHVVKCWYLLERSIRWKHDSAQHVKFCWRFVTASGKKEKKLKLKQEPAAHEEKTKMSYHLAFMTKKTDLGFFLCLICYRLLIPNNTARGKMFWEICKTASYTDKTIAQNNVLVQGFSFFHIESVKIHESSENQVWETMTILSLILHSCLDDPNYNQESRPSG